MFAARDAGRSVARPAARPQRIDEFSPKVEEWVDKSKGKIRADKVHEKLLAMGSPARSAPPAARSRQ